MNTNDIRWKQRFQNFEEGIKAYPHLSVLEKEGLLQRFEYTFKLGWKTLKDYLESQEIRLQYPREVIKQAFHYGLIENGEIWMEMLEKRNLTVHAYDEKIFNKALNRLYKDFYQALKQLYDLLKKQS